MLQAAIALLVLVFFGVALGNQLPDILSYKWEFDFAYLALALLLIVVRGPLGSHGWCASCATRGARTPTGA